MTTEKAVISSSDSNEKYEFKVIDQIFDLTVTDFSLPNEINWSKLVTL